jgi:hypothetical protein
MVRGMLNNYSVEVDVEVYLCYCTGDECNKEDIIGMGFGDTLYRGRYVDGYSFVHFGVIILM